MKRIINFSGGRSSAMMTILEYNPETDYVVFCDTGREHPKTYKFILDFEANEGIPVIKIGGKQAREIASLGSTDYFAEFLARRDFEEIPNLKKRSCTIELKVKPARRWARKNIGMAYQNLLGFRFDEQHRVKKNKKRWKQVEVVFPLNEREITKAAVNEFWKNKSYDLEIPGILGNCTLCFMKGASRVITILKHFPEFAEPWMSDESKSKSKSKFGHTYLNGITIEKCLQIGQMPDLFSSIKLEELEPEFNCNCNT